MADQAKVAPDEEKAVIHLHRSYRKLAGRSAKGHLVEYFAVVVPLVVLVFMFYQEISYFNCINAKQILKAVIPADLIEIRRQEFLDSSISLISMPAAYPTTRFSFINVLLAVSGMTILPAIKRIPRSLGIAGAFVCFIHLCSSVFFLTMPDKFPYSVETFSGLYMKTEISMWFIVPLLLQLCLLPIPMPKLTKFMLNLLVLFLLIVLSVFRYLVFLYVLNRFSLIFMADMFFVFGALINFLYVVTLYSIFFASLSRQFKTKHQVWKWSY